MRRSGRRDEGPRFDKATKLFHKLGEGCTLITVTCCPNKRISTLSTINIITLNAGNHISLSKPQPALLIVFGSRTDYPTR